MTDSALWYRDAIIYEVHVRAFCDAGADGVGNFKGLATKLDYLRDLGVTAIWLLPFYPSPLKDDGYDIADYASIHPDYGSLESFQEFLNAAHARGLKVITELVVNHTSDQHPWFQAARRAPPGSPARNFYVWSDTPDKYAGARIIFKDFEPSNWTYDRVAGAYYWHRFYSHQPDLNFDNPEVWKAIFPLFDFWMEMGVDGMRLDAIPYLYEREGTNCENLPETHTFLKALRKHVDDKYPGRMLLAEANQWPEDAVAYFGQGDECHMAFHFPVMPRLFMSIHREDRFPIIDIMDQTPPLPDKCQWALFLRNHDELTLEMVTDEERDYMYRAYAHDTRARINLGIRRRLAPLLGNNRRRIELMNGLLFSMPGTPVIYYGDEIGMGDNIYLGDRNGVRTPMQWSADRNAGFSRANPQKLYLPIVIDPEYHYETINVEAQQNNPHSLLWWMKRLIGLRKRYKAFSRGTLEFLHPENRKVLAFLRMLEDEHLLIVANLSRFVQYVELDLSLYRGSTPIELFGGTPFPRIGGQPYVLTLSPHSFYWFALCPQNTQELCGFAPTSIRAIGEIVVTGDWDQLLPHDAPQLETILPDYIQRCRWYHGWPKTIKAARIREFFRLSTTSPPAYLLVTDVEYSTGEEGTYLIPLAMATEQKASDLLEFSASDIITRIRGAAQGVLYDPLTEASFSSSLVDLVASRARIRGSQGGDLWAFQFSSFSQIRDREIMPLAADLQKQSSAIVCDSGRFALRLFHRLEEGKHPAWDIGRVLTEKKEFSAAPPLAGSIEYFRRGAESTVCALLHGFIRNEGDAWQMTLDSLSDFFERTLAVGETPQAPLPQHWPTDDLSVEPPQEVDDLLGVYPDQIRLLGQRTAELHVALASQTENPDFAPEPYSALFQRSQYQTMRNLKMEVFDQLRRRLADLPDPVQETAREVLRQDGEIMHRFRLIVDRPSLTSRIRVHGDLHLGQVLFTGKDFAFINFEGSSSMSLTERRLKRSPLCDVASMLRSLHYATQIALHGHREVHPSPQAMVRSEDVARLEPWTRYWHAWASCAYLRGYFTAAAGASFVPSGPAETRVVLDALLLERALRELAYELQHRSAWAGVPLAGIVKTLAARPGTAFPLDEPAKILAPDLVPQSAVV